MLQYQLLGHKKLSSRHTNVSTAAAPAEPPAASAAGFSSAVPDREMLLARAQHLASCEHQLTLPMRCLSDGVNGLPVRSERIDDWEGGRT